ncbi:MAG: response regulator transcription factor [Methylomicrobium sp.]|nr:response regulator transcription factor [Methylomicrobium sp.]
MSVVDRAIEIGAAGFFPKTMPLKSMLHAIRFIAEGYVYLPAEYMRRAINGGDNRYGLKARVLAFLGRGLQNKEMGRELGIEETIVKIDVKSVCRKLNMRNRTQAVIMAHKEGLC